MDRNHTEAKPDQTSPSALPKEAQDILDFWFGASPSPSDPDYDPSTRLAVWFGCNADFDALIRMKYEDMTLEAAAGKLDAWKDSPEGCLSLVLLLDQFPRNMWRGSPRMFQCDGTAQVRTE